MIDTAQKNDGHASILRADRTSIPHSHKEPIRYRAAPSRRLRSVTGCIAALALAACGGGANDPAPSAPTPGAGIDRVVGQIDTSSLIKGVASPKAINGNLAYVFDTYGINVVDISDPNSPNIISRLDHAESQSHSAAVDGHTLYMLDHYEGLETVDVSDPKNPVLSPKQFQLGEGSAVLIQISAAESAAFITNLSFGLEIIDISDPLDPSYLSIVYDFDDFIYRTAILDNVGLTISKKNNRLGVLDLSILTSPEQLRHIDLDHSPHTIAATHQAAYIGTDSGLYVFDLSDPFVPRLVDEISDYAIGDLSVEGARLYNYVDQQVLQSFDISSPLAPTLLGSYALEKGMSGYQISDSKAFIGGETGLSIVDLSHPSSPTLIGQLGATGTTSSIGLLGSRAFLSNSSGNKGIQIIDVSSPQHPKIQSNIPIDNLSSIDLADELIVAHVWNQGLKFFESNGSTEPIGTLPIEDLYSKAFTDTGLVIYFSTAEFGTTSPNLGIADISDPRNAEIIGSIYLELDDVDFGIVAATNEYAYVLSDGFTFGYPALYVVDIRAPRDPVVVSEVRLDPYSNGSSIVVSGNYAYITSTAGLTLVDISNPRAPFRGDTFDFDDSHLRLLAVEKGIAYVVTKWGDLKLIDVSNPSEPVDLGVIDATTTPWGGSAPQDMVISGTLGYVASGAGILKIYDLSLPLR
jgi:hypothetical protein